MLSDILEVKKQSRLRRICDLEWSSRPSDKVNIINTWCILVSEQTMCQVWRWWLQQFSEESLASGRHTDRQGVVYRKLIHWKQDIDFCMYCIRVRGTPYVSPFYVCQQVDCHVHNPLFAFWFVFIKVAFLRTAFDWYAVGTCVMYLCFFSMPASGLSYA